MIYVILACAFLVTLYLFFTRTFNYWKKRGIKYENPSPIFGNYLRIYAGKQNITQLAEEIYWKYPKEKVVGCFQGMQPELLVRDPDLLKRIFTTDFNHFSIRALNVLDHDSDNLEMLRKNLVFLNGPLWKNLRHATTPAFTSGKLKAMFPLIVERAERLQERALALSAAGRPLDARDLMARYTTDFIGACGFGIDADSLKEEDSEFRKLGVKIFKKSFKTVVVTALKDVFPKTFKNLKYLGGIEKEFTGLVTEIVNGRGNKPSGRHDFIDLMLEIRDKSRNDPDAIIDMNDDLLAAQVFIFFTAGFETSSSSTSYTLHQLAFNPTVQDRVRAEIDNVLAKYNNKLSYDAIKEMTYLDWTFKESLRMMPPVGSLSRTCSQSYVLPDINAEINKGVKVMIPVHALHHDPQYWYRPQEFRPERFDPEGEDEPRNKFAYLPFGGGPRACIGERLGRMQSLAGLAAILSRFEVSPAPCAPRDPLVDPRSLALQAIPNGLPLIFTERKQS